MKLLLSLAAFFAVSALSGCAPSSMGNAPVSDAQRVQKMRNDKSLPAPAQERMNGQIEAKQKMDAMRAADATKAKAKSAP